MKSLFPSAVAIALSTLVGCSSTPGATDANGVGPDGKPKNAAEIAVKLVGGKVSTYVAMDRVRAHPVGPKILGLPMVADMLDGTGIDPLKDLNRVFVTGPATNSPRLVTFAEHNLDAKAAHSALAAVVAKSDPPGQFIPTQGFEEAKVTIKKRTGIVAMLPPHFLVVVPEDLADHITDFEASGGLADPAGPEAVRSTAFDPSQSVAGPGVPNIPQTISKGIFTVLLKADGGADVDIVGDDTSADSAANDAKTVTDSFAAATQRKVMGMNFRAFDPIKFKAEGTEVKGHLALSKDDLERIISIVTTFGT